MASHEAPEPKAEFQKFQLRKTQSSAAEKSTSESASSSMSNFGVQLKVCEWFCCDFLWLALAGEECVPNLSYARKAVWAHSWKIKQPLRRTLG